MEQMEHCIKIQLRKDSEKRDVMNHIEIRKIMIPSGYKTAVFMIDEKPLYEYIIEWYGQQKIMPQNIPFAPVDMLEITWTNKYDFEGDARFMKYILQQDKAITPILSCPDDFDFTCIILVAEVIKMNNKVIWKRIGRVDHSDESFEDEKCSGILCLEAYSQDDWDTYGDNIALERVDSYEWKEWISQNWSEELYRRRVNYTYPYYQNENHIIWVAECNFEFDRKDYDSVVESCYTK